jgi:hypothetical protein
MRRQGWRYRCPPNGQFTINRNSPQANGLVAWWPTLGCFGANTLRYVGRGNSGTINADWIADGEAGPLLTFDGTTNDDFSISHATGLIGTDDWSVALWARCDGAADDTNWVAFSVEPNGFLWIYFSRWSGVTGISVDSYDSVWGVRGAGHTGFTVGKLYHIVAVGGASYLALYVDGAFANSSGTAALGAAQASTFWWGSQFGSSKYHLGDIGDVRFYNRQLSAAEVWHQYCPSTRWDLYLPYRRRFAAKPPVAAGVTVPVMYYHYAHH